MPVTQTAHDALRFALPLRPRKERERAVNVAGGRPFPSVTYTLTTRAPAPSRRAQSAGRSSSPGSADTDMTTAGFPRSSTI